MQRNIDTPTRTYRILLWTRMNKDWQCTQIMRWPRLISENLFLQRLTNQRSIIKHDQLLPKLNDIDEGVLTLVLTLFSWDYRKVTLYSNKAARPTNKNQQKARPIRGKGLTPLLFPILTTEKTKTTKTKKTKHTILPTWHLYRIVVPKGTILSNPITDNCG